MGYLFKQRYKDKKTGQLKQSRKWYGEYRDRDGALKRVPLSTDKQSAQAMLRDLERQAERQKSGLIDDFNESRKLPIDDLVETYLADMALRGRSDRHQADTKRLLETVIRACEFDTPGSLHASKLDSFLANFRRPDGEKASARTLTTYRQAVMGFANWLVKKGKIEFNPLLRSTRPEGDAAVKRRAIRLPELKRLLEVARERPAAEYKTARIGPDKGKQVRTLRPEVAVRLERLGRERVLIYKTAFYTGFRRKELTALLVGDFTLEGEWPKVFLPKERTKGKRDAILPLRLDFAAELREWVEREGLSPADPIFEVSRDVAKILRRDMKVAKIPYKDERGRVFDFHALRKCLATHLNAAGVPIVTAKEFLRHSTVELTAGVYNDEELHDLRGAADKLPEL